MRPLSPFWQNEHPLVQEDIEIIAADAGIPWEQLSGSSILITGATGLIGSLLVKSLLYYADTRGMRLHVLALTRSRKRGLSVFAAYKPLIEQGLLEIVEGDVQQPLSRKIKVDYIIHAASVTDSAEMVSNPVGTIMTTVTGTRNILELARTSVSRSCIFLSSLEVYGLPDHELVSEHDSGYLDLASVRNSYPLSKRLAENLCVAYHSQYAVPIKIARLAQTFGPGVTATDNRVFAQFARSVLAGRNIVLHTAGTTKRDYLYTADAARAILRILLLGQNGEAYNVSDPDSYITIRELAELTKSFTPHVQVVVKADSNEVKKYAPEVHINLDNSKLNNLAPFIRTPVRIMMERLLVYLRERNDQV